MRDLFDQSRHDAGGKVALKVAATVVGAAVFGGAGDCYRYRLERRLAQPTSRRTVMFLWMNPSVAEAAIDDPTVAKGWRYAQAWGFDRMLVGNVSAYRCTDQRRLAEMTDPGGPENVAHLLAMAGEAEMVVVGYGTPRLPALRAHGPRVAAAMIAAGVTLHVLRLSKDGVPCHPLYLPGGLTPVRWHGPSPSVS